MKCHLSLLCLAWLFLPAWQASRNYDFFYNLGNESFNANDYQQALEAYKEAFRLEPKAQRYKVEGAFFDNYLPRYKIALCYEKLDVLAAKEWVDKSREALESEVIKRRKNDLAQYNTDLSRIDSAVETRLADIENRYQLKLQEARGLLNGNRFEQAKTAFTDLVREFPDKTEAKSGLARVNTERDNYLKGLGLDARGEILSKNFGEVEGLIARIEAVDGQFPELPRLRALLADARAAAKRETETPVVTVAETTPPVRKPERTPPDRSPPDDERVAVNRNPPANTGPDLEKQRAEAEAKRRAALRTALLETLKPYRRGEPQMALDQLHAIDVAGKDESGSYRWFKGLYLLTIHRHALDPEPELLDQAQRELIEVARLQPDFSPDPGLYPDYVVAFYRDNTASQP